MTQTWNHWKVHCTSFPILPRTCKMVVGKVSNQEYKFGISNQGKNDKIQNGRTKKETYLRFKLFIIFNCCIVMFELCLWFIILELFYFYAFRRFCNVRTKVVDIVLVPAVPTYMYHTGTCRYTNVSYQFKYQLYRPYIGHTCQFWTIPFFFFF